MGSPGEPLGPESAPSRGSALGQGGGQRLAGRHQPFLALGYLVQPAQVSPVSTTTSVKLATAITSELTLDLTVSGFLGKPGTE